MKKIKQRAPEFIHVYNSKQIPNVMTSILDFAGLLYGGSFNVINIPVHSVLVGMSSINRKIKSNYPLKIQSSFLDCNRSFPCELRIKACEELRMFKISKWCTTYLMFFFRHFQLCDAISHGGGVVGRKRNVRQLNTHCNSCCRTNNCNRNLCGGKVYYDCKVNPFTGRNIITE